MPDTIEKLRPDRDLQCFFFHPSAIAALSSTSPTGFTVSGTWRQQFDWAVIEWNRDCVYEHPAFRPLPDGDLSGLVLTYEETRSNCIVMDSDLFSTVDWPYVRVWAETPPAISGDPPVETIFFVALNRETVSHVEPIEGTYASAYAEFTLSGTADPYQTVGLAYNLVDYTYEILPSQTLEDAITAIAAGMNGVFSPDLKAVPDGATIRVYYTAGADIGVSTTGDNGNRFSLYSYSTGPAVWDSPSKTFSSGTSPTKWKVTLDFTSLEGFTKDPSTADFYRDGSHNPIQFPIPTSKIRKIRWTYSAALQPAEFVRSEFEVVVSNWTVTGTNRAYSVAGPGSRRIEDTDSALTYSGTCWQIGRGNYSGGFIHFTKKPGDAVALQYTATGSHTLYLGTRYTNTAPLLHIQVDGTPLSDLNLKVIAEDVLIRWPLGVYSAGPHTLQVTHAGADGEDFYLDFVELAVPTTDLPSFPDIPVMTLATDWDTDHSLALAPERTAWFIDSLGFRGRQNHYVGALLFYELYNPTNSFAVASVTFSGTPISGDIISITDPTTSTTLASRRLHDGDTPATIATSFANEFNRGYTGLWASASGTTLTIQSRQLGLASGLDTLAMTAPLSTGLSYTSTFTIGVDGKWLTDLTATPRLNRAMRDWTRSFFSALHGYGMDAVAAFSTELKDGDISLTAGIAQRGPTGDPIILPTPSLQTNFSPTSQAFWRQVHADCAAVMSDAGLQPYLQLGEVQWWYSNNDETADPFPYSGMPYYDDYTTTQFQAVYGRPMHVFLDNTADPAAFPDEATFLASLLGAFTDNIMSYVRTTYPTARFEVLYPFDVNDTPFNKAVNFPVSSWTPAALDCLKTEGFRFTFTKHLDFSEQGIDMGVSLGFPSSQRSHLVGLGDATAPWLKEARIASGKGFESVVLFALDQFCLIGYPVPMPLSPRRAVRFRH